MAEKLVLQVQQYFMEAEERAQGGDQVAGMAVAEEAVDGDQAVELEPLIQEEAEEAEEALIVRVHIVVVEAVRVLLLLK